jgi:hypothetical protein
MWSKSNNTTVLSVYPTTRGYAFTLFDGPLSPHDWGIKDVPRSSSSDGILDDIEYLIERYQPDVLTIENPDQPGFKRPARIIALYFAIRALAEMRGVNVVSINKDDIANTFSGFAARTKHQIAHVIAREITAFGHLVPKPRQAWMSESRRQGLFDAAALGLTYYALANE